MTSTIVVAVLYEFAGEAAEVLGCTQDALDSGKGVESLSLATLNGAPYNHHIRKSCIHAVIADSCEAPHQGRAHCEVCLARVPPITLS